MAFRKMVTITLYARQQKRHRCVEQSFGLCWRGSGWDNFGEWHWNVYNIIYETNHQSRLDAGYRMLRDEEGNGTPLQSSSWKIPWTEEPGGPQSMGSLGVGHDWVTSLSLFTFMHWRRKWQPTPVFLPGESQGRGSLVGFHLWGRTESDTTEVT